jgi:hypothetical protein
VEFAIGVTEVERVGNVGERFCRCYDFFPITLHFTLHFPFETLLT